MNGRVFVRVFSPRRKDPITCEVSAGETFGALRCRLSKELGIAGDRGLLMHHGEHVKDDESASRRLQGADQVLFLIEIADPPKHEPLRPHSNQRMFGIGGMPGGRGAGRGMPAGNTAAGNLAASLMQRLQQAQGGAAGPPQVPAAQRPPPSQQMQQDTMMAQELLKQLTEMGFSKPRAAAALRSSNFDLIDALQWLEEHADDPDSMFEGGSNGAAASRGAAGPAPAAPSTPVQQAPSAQVVRMVPLFEPVLRAAALVAVGNSRPKQALDELRLPAMESDGWKGLHAAVRRIWTGERNAASLKAGLDANTSFIVEKVLEFVALGADTLARQADEDTWLAMPRDPEFEPVVQQLRPMLQRMAKFAVERTRESFGESQIDLAILNDSEEAQLNEFVDKMEAAQYQLKTGWEMVCAGVRVIGDLLECVSPLANGKPDDKSFRLLRTLVELITQIPQS